MLKALGEVRGEGREKSEGVRWKEGRGWERAGELLLQHEDNLGRREGEGQD